MQVIVDQLKELLQRCDTHQKESLIEQMVSLQTDQPIQFAAYYPTALKHDKKASSTTLSRGDLQSKIPSQEVRTMDLVALSKDEEKLTFIAKRPNDFWKRLFTAEHIEAMIAVESFKSSDCSERFIDNDLKHNANKQWSVETLLRDAMRANKENRDLGAKPFIIVVAKDSVDTDTDHALALLEHYFADDVEVVASKDKKTTYYLGFHEQMGKIGMRYFYRFAF